METEQEENSKQKNENTPSIKGKEKELSLLKRGGVRKEEALNEQAVRVESEPMNNNNNNNDTVGSHGW